MATDQIREVEVYLELTRASNGWNAGSKARLVGATTKPPARRTPNSVLVKIKVRVPDQAFDPAAIPALVADIPLDLLHPPQDQIDVVIDDANQ